MSKWPLIAVITITVIAAALLLPNLFANSSLRSNTQVSTERINQFVLDQLSLGPRIPGSNASLAFRDWVLDTVPSGWKVEIQNYTFLGVELRNYWITSKLLPNGSFPTVIIGAHYDSRATANQDPDNPTDPVPGANDGASGVAGIMEMLTLLDNTNTQYGFVLFDAEDQGSGGMLGWDWIIGSTQFVADMSQEQVDATELFILFDMIGDDDFTLYYEGTSDKTYRENIWDHAATLGYGSVFKKYVGYSLIDDHRPFIDRGIPAVDIIDFDYPEWHTTKDDIDNISAESIAIVADVILDWTLNQFDKQNSSILESTIQPSSTLTSASNEAPFAFSPVLFVAGVIVRRKLQNLYANH